MRSPQLPPLPRPLLPPQRPPLPLPQPRRLPAQARRSSPPSRASMENEILSDVDGTITAVHVKQGDSVLEGADIVTVG